MRASMRKWTTDNFVLFIYRDIQQIFVKRLKIVGFQIVRVNDPVHLPHTFLFHLPLVAHWYLLLYPQQNFSKGKGLKLSLLIFSNAKKYLYYFENILKSKYKDVFLKTWVFYFQRIISAIFWRTILVIRLLWWEILSSIMRFISTKFLFSRLHTDY